MIIRHALWTSVSILISFSSSCFCASACVNNNVCRSISFIHMFLLNLPQHYHTAVFVSRITVVCYVLYYVNTVVNGMYAALETASRLYEHYFVSLVIREIRDDISLGPAFYRHVAFTRLNGREPWYGLEIKAWERLARFSSMVGSFVCLLPTLVSASHSCADDWIPPPTPRSRNLVPKKPNAMGRSRAYSDRTCLLYLSLLTSLLYTRITTVRLFSLIPRMRQPSLECKDRLMIVVNQNAYST